MSSLRPRVGRFGAGALFVILALSPLRSARAADDDGLYGRFDGDVELRLGAGPALVSGGPMLSARASALYMSTAGLYADYADALGAKGPVVRRSIAAGLTLEPLFLGRFANDLERGPARLDLFLDSLALDLGAFWHAPRDGSITARPGFEVGLGIGLPIFADATGPFLDVRGALRWRAGDLNASTAPSDVLERGALISITLAWHHVVTVHIVDASDRASR